MGILVLVLVTGLAISLGFCGFLLYVEPMKNQTRNQVYGIPMIIGQTSVKQEQFSSIITSIINKTIILDNHLNFTTQDTKDLRVGKSYVNGTIEVYQALCTDKILKINSLTNNTNSSTLIIQQNPLCVNGTYGFRILGASLHP